MTETEKKELPKVLVGLATHESKGYVLDEFLLNVSRFTYQHFDIYICDNSRTEKYSNEIIYKAKELNLNIIVDRDAWCTDYRGRMVTSHNKLRERALKGGYDYLFILDQDILPKADIIEQLISHKKDVVSGLYKVNMGTQGVVTCCSKQRLKLKNCNESRNCTIELKEVGQGNQTRAAYEVKAQKTFKLFGFIKNREQVQTQIDAETGEEIKTQRPWWAWLASESEE